MGVTARAILHHTDQKGPNILTASVWTFPLQTFKSVIPSHFFCFLCQHGIGSCLNRCHNKSFVSHNVDWNKKIRNSIDSCQIQICQLIPSANRFQTSGLYRLIIFRKSLLFTILLKNFNRNYTQLYYWISFQIIQRVGCDRFFGGTHAHCTLHTQILCNYESCFIKTMTLFVIYCNFEPFCYLINLCVTEKRT